MIVKKAGVRGRPFEKGHKKVPGSGIQKGQKQKFTTLKAAFIDAFMKTGGAEGLAEWGGKNWNRKDFYKIVGSMLPKDVNVNLGGEDLAQAIKEARSRAESITAAPVKKKSK